MYHSLVTRDARGNYFVDATGMQLTGMQSTNSHNSFGAAVSTTDTVQYRRYRAKEGPDGRFHCLQDDVLSGPIEQLRVAAGMAAGEPNPTPELKEFVNHLVKEAHDAKEMVKGKDEVIAGLSRELSRAQENNRLGMEELKKYQDENLQLKARITELEGKLAAPPPSPYGMAAPSPYTVGAVAFGGPAAGAPAAGGAVAFGGPAFGGPAAGAPAAGGAVAFGGPAAGAPAAGGAVAFGGPAFGGPAQSPVMAPADNQPSWFGGLSKFTRYINPGDGRSSDSRASSRASSAIRKSSMGVRHGTAFAAPKARKVTASSSTIFSPPSNVGSRPVSVSDRFIIRSDQSDRP